MCARSKHINIDGAFTESEVPDIEKLSESGEDYIEALVMLSEGGKTPVRSVDLAQKLGVSKPSVTKAIAALRDLGLVEQVPYGDIFLTQMGIAYGQSMWRRHRVLTSFLSDMLGVDESVAEGEACCIEHVISQDTFNKWEAYMNKRL